MSNLLRKVSPVGMLMALFVLVSCQNSTASPTAAVIPNPPTATAVGSTATPVPTTPPVVTEREPIIPTTRSQVPRIRPQELKEKLDAGVDVIVVDSRSLASYERRHIPGALSIPLSEIEERRDELPQEGEIVFYCT